MSRCQIFNKYQILIYSECADQCCALRLNRIVPRVLLVLLVGLLLSGSFLLIKAIEVQSMHRNLARLERESLTQRSDLLVEARELSALRGEYDRVDTFNHKLKVMLNMDEADEEDLALGGSNLAFTRASITPYNIRSLVRNMQRGTKSLGRDIFEAERVQQNVFHEMRRNMSILAWTPSVWPVKGRVTSSFGMRNHPFDSRYRMHQGIDIVPYSGRGTPIHAPADGVVLFSGNKGYYGLTLKIRHYGNLTTKYAHLQRLAVKVGQTVSRGDVIAFVGNSGRSTGPHLHYEVLVNGKATNPRRYILN